MQDSETADSAISQLLQQYKPLSESQQAELLNLLHTDKRESAVQQLYASHIPIIVRLAYDIGDRWYRGRPVPESVLLDSIQALSDRLLRILDVCDSNRAKIITLFVFRAFSDVYRDVYRHLSPVQLPHKLSAVSGKMDTYFGSTNQDTAALDSLVDSGGGEDMHLDDLDEWTHITGTLSWLSNEEAYWISTLWDTSLEPPDHRLLTLSKGVARRRRRAALAHWAQVLARKYDVPVEVMHKRLSNYAASAVRDVIRSDS